MNMHQASYLVTIRLIILFNNSYILGIYSDSIIFLKRKFMFWAFALAALFVQTYGGVFLITFC